MRRWRCFGDDMKKIVMHMEVETSDDQASDIRRLIGFVVRRKIVISC